MKLGKIGILVFILLAIVACSASAEATPTSSATVGNRPTEQATSTQPVVEGTNEYVGVFIKGGTAKLGRTEAEVEQDYADCVEMAQRTDQPGICDIKEEVFGDQLYRTEIIKDFYIDQTETPDPNGLPFMATYEDAVMICAERGGRLPTASEWEYAARGEEGRLWPWGNEAPTPDLANLDFAGGNKLNDRQSVEAFVSGATPEGVLNMVGNAPEWVQGGFLKGGGAGTFVPFAKPAHLVTITSVGTVRCVNATMGYSE